MSAQARLPIIGIGSRVRLPSGYGWLWRSHWGEPGTVVELVEQAVDLGELWLVRPDNGYLSKVKMFSSELQLLDNT